MPWRARRAAHDFKMFSFDTERTARPRTGARFSLAALFLGRKCVCQLLFYNADFFTAALAEISCADAYYFA